MSRIFPLFLGLFVAVAACAQEAPAEQMTDDDAPVAAPDVPARANDEARPSPNAAVSQTIGTTVVSVEYGRPSLRGRAVFGGSSELAPTGQVWRTGANEAATVMVSDDVMVEGQPLPAGVYSLFTIPGEDSWTVIFNETAEQWGAFRYDEAEDALRVEVAPMAGAPMMEQFQIRFEDVSDDAATLILHWGTTGVPVRISAAG